MTTPSADMPSDLQLPFAVCSDCLWSAAYLAERERREQLDRAIGGTCGADTEVKRSPKRRASVKEQVGTTTTRPPNEVVIDNLIILLRSKGIPDDEIRTAILHGKAGQSDAAAAPAESTPSGGEAEGNDSGNNDNGHSSEGGAAASCGERSDSPDPDGGREGDAIAMHRAAAGEEPARESADVNDSGADDADGVMEDIDLGGMGIGGVSANDAVPLTADCAGTDDDVNAWDI